MKYNSDSLFHVLMTRLADAMILNILFIITSLPIITIGVSWASMYYVTLKIIQDEKNEEISILKNYLYSFKQNLLQGIEIWILALLFGGVLFLDLRIISSMEAQAFRKALFVATGTVVLLFVLTLQFVFPYLSRFCTKFLTTIKNAALMAIAQFPRAIIMTVITAVAVWLTLLNKYTIYTGIFFWLFIGFSTIALVKARIFIRIFQDIEQNQTELKQKD